MGALLKIPKIIHRVWLKDLGGPQKPPAALEAYWEKFKELYPGWEFQTWDGSEFEFPNQEYYNVSACYAWKSDLFRYEVLRRVGGLYVDCDIEPRINAEHLFAPYKVFAPKQIWGGISNAMMGSVPGHPIWTRILKKIYRRPLEYYENRIGGMNVDKVSQLSGPLHINKLFLHDVEATLIDGGLLLTTEQNRHDYPDAAAHHYGMNHWRSPVAMEQYRKVLGIKKKSPPNPVTSCNAGSSGSACGLRPGAPARASRKK